MLWNFLTTYFIWFYISHFSEMNFVKKDVGEGVLRKDTSPKVNFGKFVF